MKKYIVKLTDEERAALNREVKARKGAARRLTRASILLKADAGWKDERIAELLECTTTCVALVRKRFIQRGLQKTMDGLPRKPRSRVLDGEQEARIIALRLGEAPEGYAAWSLRLLEKRVVELGIVEHVSRQTLCKLFKKRK